MREMLVAALLALASSLPAFAGVHNVPRDEPIATITIPDDWKTAEIDHRIETASPDAKVHLAVEKTESDSIKECVAAALKYLTSKGVTPTESSMKQAEGTLAGIEVVDISWDGKDAGAPTKVRLIIVPVTKTQGLLVIYWLAPPDEKKHADALASIARSIRKT
jgi:hypothetical protein